MRVSSWTVAAAALITFSSVASVIIGIEAWNDRQNSQAKLEEERAQRQAPVAEVAPAPLPTTVPLVGEEGRDTDGYPTRYVDRAALRTLLWHKRYADLTRHFERFQSDFEADPRREYWPSDAGDAFDSAEPDLLPGLDAWAAATPESFAPYLARGRHSVTVAYARRGTKWARETAREHFAAMEEAMQRGLADLDQAITLRPRLVAAMRTKISAFRSRGALEEMRQTVDQALAVCPACFQVRATYVGSIVPRWGGSYEAMRDFAREGNTALNPRMRFLPGYVDLDRAQMFLIEKSPQDALAAIERACALGEYWEFLEQRAEIRDHLNDPSGALADLERAIALRPGHPRLLIWRAYVHHRAQRWEPAGRDLLAGIRMDPTDWRARWMLDAVVKGLIYDGWVHHKAGRRQDALRIYDLAAELAPRNPEVQSRRKWVIAGEGGSSTEELAVLEEQVRKAPDDFRALQQLDYALARRGQFERVVELWTAYLARHPQDGPAHLERGGAYFQLGRLAEARADARRACELGISEGCAREKQVAAMQK
jgi:tetratricopeptide (TPR) repeat protein